MGNSRNPWLIGLNFALVAVALSWIAYIIFGEWDSLVAQLAAVYWPGLLLLVFLGSVYTLHSAFIFILFFNHYTERKYPFSQLARLLFTGQLIRHLPGRFWGVVFQVNETKQVLPVSSMVRVNVDLMVVTIMYAMLFALTVIGYTFFGWLAAGLLLPGLVLVSISIHYNWPVLMLVKIAGILPDRISKRLQDAAGQKRLPWSKIVQLNLYQLSAYLFYYTGWVSFSIAWPDYAVLDFKLLGATYLLAWLAGFLSIATPSGLGVREAVFLLLSPGANQTMVAVVALLARMWLLVNDIVLFLVFLARGEKFESHSDSDTV